MLIFTYSEFRRNNAKVMLCDRPVKIVKEVKHLGYSFSSDYCHASNLVNIESIIRDMKVRTNAIITQFKAVSWK